MKLKNPDNYKVLIEYGFLPVYSRENNIPKDVKDYYEVWDEEDFFYYNQDCLVLNLGHSRRGQFYYLYYNPNYNSFNIYASKPDGEGTSVIFPNVIYELIKNNLIDE